MVYACIGRSMVLYFANDCVFRGFEERASGRGGGWAGLSAAVLHVRVRGRVQVDWFGKSCFSTCVIG